MKQVELLLRVAHAFSEYYEHEFGKGHQRNQHRKQPRQVGCVQRRASDQQHR
jgi:hypothetical protein